ncbi:MAG TPA: xanthine dehydrogenase small subunit [Ramlibacter sp.]|nr:xanthine dehydrogenase small subunit [Ramlibacter sp.]
MEAKPIRFVRRGQIVSLDNVPPERTLLEVLREDLGATGTKEGCGEGDCGACTVVLGEMAPGARGQREAVRYQAINSCIRLAHSIDGRALWTVEDLAAEDGSLHPAQEAMVGNHGSQCGFCTPGFVMSLFGMYQNHVCRGEAITRELAQEELSGNLCRCTGYRPILDAAQTMGALPLRHTDDKALLRQLKRLGKAGMPASAARYLAPTSLSELLSARTANPKAQIVAGCTDVGLWVTKMHLQFAQVLDVTRVEELRRIERYEHHVSIGAAVNLTDAYAALVADRPQLKTFANRFAGLPVRNAGTLGGNVANGSPIGDSMPLLMALKAHLVLMSARGHREMRLEDFYAGYRKTVLAPDEVLAWIKVPRPSKGEFLRAYKISKRYDDDISAVCLVLNLRFEGGRVAAASIGAGGVAATPARAARTEAFLLGKAWTQAAVHDAADVLRAEFQPIGDIRASAAYRREVLGNLLQRFWLESQGVRQINLEQFTLPELA